MSLQPQPEFEFHSTRKGYEVIRGGEVLGLVWTTRDGWQHNRSSYFRYERREDAARGLARIVDLDLREVAP